MGHPSLDEGKEKFISLNDYWRVLGNSAGYRTLFFAYCIDNAGNWLSFIACLSIIDQYGLAGYTSLYLICRLLPSVCLSGFVGPIADKVNKRDAMIFCNLGSATSLALLSMDWPESIRLPVIYVVALIQFSFDALYCPLRQSFIPLVVEEADMQVVTTLDSLCWSTIGALGATLGGAICSAFGNRIAFLTDMTSFIVVAALTASLPRDYEVCKKEIDGVAPSHASAESSREETPPTDSPPGSSWDMLIAAWRYIRNDPKVFSACFMKGCGSLLWSVSDLLQVSFSRMVYMQSLGDQQLTLGLLYSMVGLGCYIGPFAWNMCTAQDGSTLFSRVVSTFANMCLGFLLIVFAPNIYVLMLATAIRASGAGTLWTYSSLLLQIWVPPEMKGRVFAFENFIYTLSSIGSLFLCAAFFDILKLDERSICIIMFVFGLSVLTFWTGLYFLLFKTNFEVENEICLANISSSTASDDGEAAMGIEKGADLSNRLPAGGFIQSVFSRGPFNKASYSALAAADDELDASHIGS